MRRTRLQPIAFVCRHIIDAPAGVSVGFVSYAPESADDLRDAWCNACDVYLQDKGGDWVDDEVEVPGGIGIVCAECYRARETDALQAGRRIIYRDSQGQ